ncbi:MAG: hypothetical protein OEW75_15580 [Cyclobacteriaceae bacterium]|nr:hypothetical protein [Cyclobacteriaceae bacterium]
MLKLHYFIIALLVTFCVACEKELQPESCEFEATVVDLTGLDGCGFILQMEDGTRYEPVHILYCGTPGNDGNFDVPDDPLIGFEFYDGQKVSFSFEPIEMASICMVGQTIRVTCLSEIVSNNIK